MSTQSAQFGADLWAEPRASQHRNVDEDLGLASQLVTSRWRSGSPIDIFPVFVTGLRRGSITYGRERFEIYDEATCSTNLSFNWSWPP